MSALPADPANDTRLAVDAGAGHDGRRIGLARLCARRRLQPGRARRRGFNLIAWGDGQVTSFYPAAGRR